MHVGIPGPLQLAPLQLYVTVSPVYPALHPYLRDVALRTVTHPFAGALGGVPEHDVTQMCNCAKSPQILPCRIVCIEGKEHQFPFHLQLQPDGPGAIPAVISVIVSCTILSISSTEQESLGPTNVTIVAELSHITAKNTRRYEMILSPCW